MNEYKKFIDTMKRTGVKPQETSTYGRKIDQKQQKTVDLTANWPHSLGYQGTF